MVHNSVYPTAYTPWPAYQIQDTGPTAGPAPSPETSTADLTRLEDAETLNEDTDQKVKDNVEEFIEEEEYTEDIRKSWISLTGGWSNFLNIVDFFDPPPLKFYKIFRPP